MSIDFESQTVTRWSERSHVFDSNVDISCREGTHARMKPSHEFCPHSFGCFGHQLHASLHSLCVAREFQETDISSHLHRDEFPKLSICHCQFSRWSKYQYMLRWMTGSTIFSCLGLSHRDLASIWWTCLAPSSHDKTTGLLWQSTSERIRKWLTSPAFSDSRMVPCHWHIIEGFY